MADMTKTIFIGGTGRCGTTLLKSIIGTHPSITSIPREFRLHIAPGGFLDLKRDLTKNWSRTRGNAAVHQFISICQKKYAPGFFRKVVERVFRQIFSISPFATSASSLESKECFGAYYRERLYKLVDQIVVSSGQSAHPESPGTLSSFFETKRFEEEDMNRVLSEFVDDLFQHVDGQNGIWCEDSPPNLLHFKSLNELFSDRTVKFIHIVRHPEDVVASWTKQSLDWSPNTFKNALFSVREVMNEIDRKIEGNREIDLKHVRFESLIKQPDKTLSELFHYLDEEYTDQLPEPDESKANIGRGNRTFDQEQLEQINNSLLWFYEKYGR